MYAKGSYRRGRYRNQSGYTVATKKSSGTIHSAIEGALSVNLSYSLLSLFGIQAPVGHCSIYRHLSSGQSVQRESGQHLGNPDHTR